MAQYAEHFQGDLDTAAAAGALNGVGRDCNPFAVAAGAGLEVDVDIFPDVDAVMAVTDSIPATGTVSLLLNSLFEDTVCNRQYCYFDFPRRPNRMEVKDLPNMMVAKSGDCLRFQVSMTLVYRPFHALTVSFRLQL